VSARAPDGIGAKANQAWARVATAAVLAPVTLAAVWLVPGGLFAVLVAGLAVLEAAELFDLARRAGLRPYTRMGMVAAAAVALAFGWPGARGLEPVVVLITAAVLVRCLGDSERMETSLGAAGATLLGALYLGLGMGAAAAVRGRAHGAAWVTLLLVIVWAGDVAAMYVGKAWGRTKMAPRVSPHKTWAGAEASLLVAAVVGGGAGAIWPQIFGFWAITAGLGIGVNIAAQAGDLTESVFKRGVGVKDSGGLLPGHGGMLDRMDALLLAAPALWLWLSLAH
jgi:phosphatidate cytidylyltransferase